MPNTQLNQKISIKKNTKDKTPKVMFTVLIVFGFLILLFGVLKIAQGLKSPFNGIKAVDLQSTDLGNAASDEMADLIKLQSTDTDNDGLSDYDEIYIYGTSAYLADTDSDGYSDKTEIDSNHDPLCATGKNCRSSSEESVDNTTNTSSAGANEAGGETTTNNTLDITPEMKEQLGSMSADEIRQLLLASGQVTEEQLKGVDDETLLATFKQILGE